MLLSVSDDQCAYVVKVHDPVGCPVLSMPAFTIFIDKWPWIMGYFMIGLGAYMLAIGSKHFNRVSRVFNGLFFFGLVVTLLSINGFVEH